MHLPPMKSRIAKALALTLALLACAAPHAALGASGPSATHATGNQDDTAFAPRDRAAAPETKEPWRFFGRPAEKSPAAQLARVHRFEKSKRWSAARKAADALVHNWGASAEASEAQLTVAQIYERELDFESAFQEYQYWIEHYSAGGPERGFSYGLIVASQRAIANEMLSKLQRGGIWAPSPEHVASMFRHVVANAPDDPESPRCILSEGLAYELGHKWVEAVRAYEKVAAKHPSSPLVADAWYRSGACRWELSRKRPNDARELENALEVLRLALRTAPSHPDAATAASRVAVLAARQSRLAWEHAAFYDRVRRNPEAALAAYREFATRNPSAPETPLALARIRELEQETAGKPASSADAEGETR